jgi:hypothetical protein
MSSLGFNLQFSVIGYEFESSIRTLKKSFELSRAALDVEVGRIRNDLAAYLASGEFIGERTDEGDIIWDQERAYEMDIEAAEEAIEELRRTYVIAIYHRWERGVRLSTRSDEHSHLKLVKVAEKHGIHPLPVLEKISHLVNLLKHNNAKWDEKLLASWSDVVHANILNRRDGDFCASIVLTDKHIEEILNAVAVSGPVAFPNGRP